MCEVMYGKLTKAQHEGLFRKYGEAGVAIGAQNATTYTCPVYASLISLALTIGNGLSNQRILCMAYGSGCAASMHGLDATAAPVYASDVLAGLRDREQTPIEDALLLVSTFEMTHR
jgi:3-hydroxy-3-methylglutaryl CoA synthase